MTLLDLLDKNMIKVPLLSSDKNGVIDELLDTFQKSTSVSDSFIARVKSAILERERQGSTAMENSIAIPHAKVEGLDKAFVVIGVSRIGVDFGGAEKSKVFFLVVTPKEKPSEHLQLLSSIARLGASPVVSRLMQTVKTKDELYQLLMD